MTTERPHDWQVSKTFPARGRLQQHRLRAPVQLTCRRCGAAKKTRLVAVIDGEWTQLLCNGCYGALLGSGEVPPSKQPADAPAMAGALRYAELMAEVEALIADARQLPREANVARRAVHQLRARDQQVGRGAASSEADLQPKSSYVLAAGKGEGREGQFLLPAEVDTEGAWWIDGTNFEEGRFVWRTVLSWLDIARGCCLIPSVPELEEMAEFPTKLKLGRSGRSWFPEAGEVSLRISPGAWELAGFEWSSDVLPGSQATFSWDLYWDIIYCELAPPPQHQKEPAGAVDEHDHEADQAVDRTRADEEAEGAWWLGGEDPPQGCLSWRVALYRMHLNGNWCPLPDGKPLHDWAGQPLRLHLRHDGSADLGTTRAHQVTLRRRGGQWELAGVNWPHDLPPGTYVILTWQLDRGLVIAETRPLSEPKQVDDRRYAYEYNAQVVTRQNAPGADQDRAVPDLTDMSWVLRTLRLLGYLDADGEAILAEDALVRNCEEAGMPRRRLGGIEEAVEKLILAGHVTRVEGSVDPDGRPWYPPRPGSVRTSLLRYKPRVQALPRQSSPYGSGEGHGNRREHWVSGFVRRLPPGASPSEQQIEAHRQAVAAAEVMDRELPAGYTFVRPHQRNQ
ncbi:hypothetical protein ACK8GE_17050 [Micromonosporaceae bacterium DT194]|uniref:hypothetical protein n=1 Tax=Melissospora conviva TaxID=3388432 RepID=UPI003C234C40